MKKSIFLFMSILLFVFSCTQPTGNPGGREVVLNDNADLSALTLSDNLQFRQPFYKDSNYYTLTVQNSQEQITMTPVLADSKASFSITNNDLVVSNPIALSVGLNNIKVKVTAENGSTTKIYQFNITRQGKNNADLIGIKGITLKEKFESHVTDYTAYVDLSTDSVTIIPELSDPKASCTVNNSPGSATLQLRVGANNVNILVTAENGRDLKHYRVVITKWDGSDASIRGFNGITLNEPFTEGVYTYSANIADNEELNLIPSLVNSHSSYTIKVNGAEASNPLSLKYGPNLVDVSITSKDGKKSLLYKLNINRSYVIDDFETKDLSRTLWKHSEQSMVWFHHKDGSNRAFLTGANYSAHALVLALYTERATEIQFDYSVTNCPYGDNFTFLINGQVQLTSDYSPTKTVKFTLSPGVNVLNWRTSSGAINLYLDNLISLGGKVEAGYAPPGGLMAGNIHSATAFNFIWSPTQGAQGYNVYRALTATGPYEKLNNESYVNTNFKDTNLTPDTTYFYKVSTIINGIESYKSTYLECRTKPAPSTPANLKAVTVSDASIDLSWSWTVNTDYYNIYKADSNGVYNLEISTRYREWTDNNLSPATTYSYKISASGNGVESPLSAPIEVLTAPAVPQNITHSATTDSITLQWTPSPTAKAYNVYRAEAEDGVYQLVSPPDYSETTYADGSLTAGVRYYYKIEALNGPLVSYQSAIVKTNTKLPTPTNFRLVFNTLKSVSIGWDKLSIPVHYEIFRANVVEGPYEKLPYLTLADTFEDDGVTDNTTYFYKIHAVNDAQCYSDQTAPIQADTNQNIDMPIPTDLTIKASYSNGFEISWRPIIGVVRGYVLYYSTTGRSGSYQVYDQYSSTSCRIDGKGYIFSPNTTYYFKVSAFNKKGEGGKSYSTSGTTTGL